MSFRRAQIEQSQGGPPRRRASGRIRQWSDKMKVIDQDTRREITNRRLEGLENDNYNNDDDDNVVGKGDDEYMELELEDDETGRERPSKRRRPNKVDMKRRFREAAPRSFQQVLDLERYDAYPADVPTYYSIEAPPSKYPPRKFCVVCGNDCSYCCPRCGVRFCRSKCNETHKETICLKFVQ